MRRICLLSSCVALALCAPSSRPVAAEPVPVTSPPVAAPRPAPPPRSPSGLAALLAEWDRGQGERPELRAAIDRMAGQLDAVASRLYWYTDLAEATAEAARTGRPILSLRLLGRLDEELSCANSRLFRLVLYADPRVSRLMRDEFVLYWSSERPAPRMTIDYGDGRVIERTITGNSAHYVLDARGRVVDALPGLYGPTAFERALKESLELARMSALVEDDASAKEIAKHHTRAAWMLTASWRKLLVRAYADYVDSVRDAKLPSLPSFGSWPDPLTSSLPASQVNELTSSKADMEAPSMALMNPEVHTYGDWGDWDKIARLVTPEHLDDASRALIRDKHPRDWQKSEVQTLDAAQLEKRLVQFEKKMTMEDLRNEYVFHAAIHRRLSKPVQTDFASLNEFVYTKLFRTPKSDGWLGLGPAEAFTGIADDGIRSSPL